MQREHGNSRIIAGGHEDRATAHGILLVAGAVVMMRMRRRRSIALVSVIMIVLPVGRCVLVVDQIMPQTRQTADAPTARQGPQTKKSHQQQQRDAAEHAPMLSARARQVDQAQRADGSD